MKRVAGGELAQRRNGMDPDPGYLTRTGMEPPSGAGPRIKAWTTATMPADEEIIPPGPAPSAATPSTAPVLAAVCHAPLPHEILALIVHQVAGASRPASFAAWRDLVSFHSTSHAWMAAAQPLMEDARLAGLQRQADAIVRSRGQAPAEIALAIDTLRNRFSVVKIMQDRYPAQVQQQVFKGIFQNLTRGPIMKRTAGKPIHLDRSETIRRADKPTPSETGKNSCHVPRIGQWHAPGWVSLPADNPFVRIDWHHHRTPADQRHLFRKYD